MKKEAKELIEFISIMGAVCLVIMIGAFQQGMEDIAYFFVGGVISCIAQIIFVVCVERSA